LFLAAGAYRLIGVIAIPFIQKTLKPSPVCEALTIVTVITNINTNINIIFTLFHFEFNASRPIIVILRT
jgi:hypothetical protein